MASPAARADGIVPERNPSLRLLVALPALNEARTVGDVVRAHNLALQVTNPLTVNVSSATPLSVSDPFKMMADEIAYDQSPVYKEERAGDLKHSVLANAKAQEILGWSPETSLSDGLHKTLDWVRTSQ